jgi:Ankyrin repeats (many copies)
MKSKKCGKCGFVCGETAEFCKGCGASFTGLSPDSSEFALNHYEAANGSGDKQKKLAQAALASVFAALVWSRLYERVGKLSVLLTVTLLLAGVAMAVVALVKIKNNPFIFGGQRFAQAALAASGVVVLLYGMAIPSLIVREKVTPVSWSPYESEEGRFSIRMPGKANHTLQFLGDKVQVPIHLASVDLGLKGACVSAYGDYSKFTIPVSADAVLDAATDHMPLLDELTVISKTPISLHGYQGREVVMQPDAKYGRDTFAIGRIYFVPPRLYINIIAGPKASELYEGRLTFLDSFRPLGTPLIDAAEQGQIAVISNLWLEATDQREREIAFVRAARKGRKETLRYLHDADVSINATDDLGRTALMMTAAYSTPVDQRVESCATFLIGRGANLDVQDNDRQWTALMWSLAEGDGTAALSIIRAGADVNLKARNGETALSIAQRQRRQDIVDALQKAGASE